MCDEQLLGRVRDYSTIVTVFSHRLFSTATSEVLNPTMVDDSGHPPSKSQHSIFPRPEHSHRAIFSSHPECLSSPSRQTSPAIASSRRDREPQPGTPAGVQIPLPPPPPVVFWPVCCSLCEKPVAGEHHRCNACGDEEFDLRQPCVELQPTSAARFAHRSCPRRVCGGRELLQLDGRRTLAWRYTDAGTAATRTGWNLHVTLRHTTWIYESTG